MPPEGVLKSRLPAWKSTTVRFLAAPSLGAGFAQYMLEIEPAGGTAQPICVDLQHFFYVVAGGVDVTIGSDPRWSLLSAPLSHVPPGVSFTMSCHPTAPARIIAVKKRYEQAEGIAALTAIIGQQQSMPMTNHTGLRGRGFKHLLPMGDLRFDFEMNLDVLPSPASASRLSKRTSWSTDCSCWRVKACIILATAGTRSGLMISSGWDRSVRSNSIPPA